MAPTTRRIDPTDRHHIENIEGQEEVTFDTQKIRVTTRKTQKTGFWYCRPNREYTKKTKWSEAMNKEITYCTYEPNQRERIPKEIKRLMGQKLDQMDGKQQAQQVRNIKTKKQLSECVIHLLEQSLTQLPEQNREKLTTKRPEKQHENENVNTHEQNIELQNENIDIQEQNKETENQNEHSEQMSKETKSLTDPATKEYLSQRWNENFQRYVNKNVDDREYSTTINPPPSENYLRAMDEIVGERMAETFERHGNNLWTLDVIYCTMAITLIKKEGKVREVKKRSGMK